MLATAEGFVREFEKVEALGMVMLRIFAADEPGQLERGAIEGGSEHEVASLERGPPLVGGLEFASGRSASGTPRGRRG